MAVKIVPEQLCFKRFCITSDLKSVSKVSEFIAFERTTKNPVEQIALSYSEEIKAQLCKEPPTDDKITLFDDWQTNKKEILLLSGSSYS